MDGTTPAGSTAPSSANSTPLSDYSPHSQPFAERPENRTTAGMAARQGLSALPSPPPFTPAAGQQQSGTPGQFSAAGSNDMHKHARRAADTPGVTSAWQGGGGASPGSNSTFAFTPTGEASSPDAQPFGPAEKVRETLGGGMGVGRASWRITVSTMLHYCMLCVHAAGCCSSLDGV